MGLEGKGDGDGQRAKGEDGVCLVAGERKTGEPDYCEPDNMASVLSGRRFVCDGSKILENNLGRRICCIDAIDVPHQ